MKVKRFVQELVLGKLEAESDLIEERRLKEIKEEKRFKEYWKLCYGKEV